MKDAESNVPQLPDPVGMYAPAGPDGDKSPVWHHGHVLDAIRAAVLEEREACASIADENGKDEPYGHAKFRCGNIADAIRNRP